MSAYGTVYLMYHELEVPGRELCQNGKGYVRYVLPEASFRKQLSRLKTSGFEGWSVGQALARLDTNRAGVAITFDDGCETDLIVAAPLLREAGFNATFYLTGGFLGRRGYLSPTQARELSDLGFEIGCHSMTHRFLIDLAPSELRAETAEAKERLEQMIGQRVEHFSCPGGRWNRRVAEMAREAGYRSVATSRIGTNSPAADWFRLARVAVLRGISVPQFDRLCRGKGLLFRQSQEVLLAGVKGVLGNSVYVKVRATVLARDKN